MAFRCECDRSIHLCEASALINYSSGLHHEIILLNKSNPGARRKTQRRTEHMLLVIVCSVSWKDGDKVGIISAIAQS